MDETTEAPEDETTGDDEDDGEESATEEGAASAAPSSEFPSDWHRERYVEDLARELVGQ